MCTLKVALFCPWHWQKFTGLIISIVGRDAGKWTYIVATVFLKVSLAVSILKNYVCVYIYIDTAILLLGPSTIKIFTHMHKGLSIIVLGALGGELDTTQTIFNREVVK